MTEDQRATRRRAYDQAFQKKLGELADFAGRALVAAGLGGALVKFIEAKAITFTLAAFVVTCVGLGLIFTGLHWQADSAAEAKDTSDDIP
jgi:hypothetical protein